MHLNRFVAQREVTWKQLSSLLKKIDQKGLLSLTDDELESFIKLYRQSSSDLNFLRTYYRESNYTSELNNLITRSHAYAQAEAQNEPLIKKMKHFFLHGFPLLVKQEFRLFLMTISIFILAALFSFVSIRMDYPWADSILSAQIQEQLSHSINEFREGEEIIPITMQPLFASIIVTNNIQVSFLAFAGGFFAGLGTIYILAVNGFMLGSYAGFFALHNHTLPFWGLILPHGIIELTAIFICATGGLVLGRAFLMPGDYKRTDSVKLAGKKAVLLLLGTIPMFIVAALIEGFITPAPIPSYARLIFAGFTAIVLVFYLKIIPKKPTLRNSLKVKGAGEP